MRIILFIVAILFSCLTGRAQVTVTYTYDNLNNLIQIKYSNGTEILFKYDALGNRNNEIRTTKSIPLYTITTSSNPPAGGSTSGGGSYEEGRSVTITATANSGYTFKNWAENGTKVSTNASYQFTVNKNRTLVANFEKNVNSYTITTSSNPAAGGTTSGDGSYEEGKSVTITATANSGYTFKNWTENGAQVSTSASYQFTVNKNRTLVANFEKNVNSYTITTSSNPAAGGSTSGGGSYEEGKNVTVTATANSGYTFKNWTENGTQVSTNASYQFTVNKNRTLVANFEKNVNSYTITTSSNPAAGGSTSGGGSYEEGKSVTITATANSGYTFKNWTENGAQVSTNASYQFTVNKNRTLVANFEKNVNSYTITTSSNPAAGGTTSGGGKYEYNNAVTVKAKANTGYTFSKWTENGIEVSKELNYTFLATNNRNLIANFEQNSQNSYVVTLISNPAEGGVTNGSGSYEDGKDVKITATPNKGYEFINWTENGSVVTNEQNYTFTISGNRTLVANFQKKTYSVITSVDPIEAGTTTGDGEFLFGSVVTVTVSSNFGYEFKGWSEKGKIVSKDSVYQFKIESDRNLVAKFDLHPITMYPNPFEDFILLNTDIESIEKVQFFDLTGRLLAELEGNKSTEFKVNTSMLWRGRYLLKVFTDKRTVGYIVVRK